VGTKEYVYCPNHATTKWVLESKHKDGCTLDSTWCYPTKNDHQDDTKPAAKTEGSKELKYARALMHVVRKTDEEDEENI
jgi:hypothetical protein